MHHLVGGEKCLCIQLSAFSLSNRGCLKSFMQALCGTFEVKIPFFLFHQIYCGFFFLLAVKGIILGPELWHISRWQVHCYRLWRQEGHGVWSDLLDWEVTDWSTQASGGGKGDIQLLTPVTLLVKQTGTALVCLSDCLSHTHWLFTDWPRRWTSGYWGDPGLSCLD